MSIIFEETYYIYLSFLSSFLISTLVCFIEDMKSSTKHIQQQGNNKTELTKLYFKALPLVLLNIFVSIPIILILFQYFHFIFKPFSFTQLLYFPLYLVVTDFAFYICHYSFHTTKLFNLYKYHKVHHQFTKPISISSIYLHPIDLLFGNIVPLFAPIFIFPSSFIILYFWTFFTIFETTYGAHSGIKNRGEEHDIHHKYFKYNYGSAFYLSDKLFRTYHSF